MGGTMRNALVGVTVIMVTAGLVTGCSERVAGDAAVAGTVGGATSATTAGGAGTVAAATMNGVTCSTNQFNHNIWCDTPSVRATNAAAGKIRVSEGAAIRFGGTQGTDRICTVGAIVRDDEGTAWALSGPRCATVAGTKAYTADGYEFGVVSVMVKNARWDANDVAHPETHWEIPAVRLGDNATATPTAKGVAAMTNGMTVTVRGARSTITRPAISAYELDAVLVNGAVRSIDGDRGAPVLSADGKLLGLLALEGGLATASDITASITALGTGAKIATS